MNTERRADLLDEIAELGRRYPNWRLGQLVANIAGWADQDVWDIEDEQLLAAVQLHLQQLAPSEAASSANETLHLTGPQVSRDDYEAVLFVWQCIRRLAASRAESAR